MIMVNIDNQKISHLGKLFAVGTAAMPNLILPISENSI